ncbi:MAG: hypothetical protein NTY48_05800, partial [Candidatus Diapherotrites archaeon]|nr:hypothetical protein [Candidatus Diapherotrites archaeon]
NALIDPGTDIRVDANITEYIGIKDINLFTRVYNPNTSTWSDWSSSAMVNDANYGNYKFHYYADFNTTPEVDSLWQYKIYSSDTLDHNSDTNTVSVYSYWDWTWSATPSSFDTRVVLFGEQASLGDLSITNTGDELLNLMISSDWDNKDQITYNGLPETSIGYRFSIDTGSSILIRTKANAKTVQSDVNFGIYVNALDSLASPAKTTTLARVVSYAGGSYLLIDWVDSNTSVTKGDTGLLYTVRVTNKGNETATIPITLDWNIPSGWTLTSGVLSTILDSNLNVDSYISNSIGLTVSDSAVSGAQNIIFTAGCCGDVNKTQTSTLAVTVNDTSVIVVNPPEEQGGAAGAGPGGGAGIGGGGGSIFSTAQEAEFFKTSERFELIRGKDDEFIVRVKNPFSDRNLLGLTASVSGLLSKYLEIVNPSIGDLGPGQEKSFTVKVAAPKYFDIGKHDLVFTINGILASGKGKRETSFTYENKVVLAVHDLNISEAIDIVNNGAGKINELKALGVNVEPLEKLLVDANIRLNGEDYEGAKTNIESILALSGIAIQVLKDLNSISEGMSKSASNGVDTPKTMRLFTIAKLAFERGEYDKANLVLKDALLTMSLETKGAFNAGYFIVQNSAQIGAGIIIALVFLSSLFLFIKRSLLKRRVGKLGYEENLLLSLMKELQKACFVDNKIGMDEYQTALKHYENRLGTAVDKIINTQNELSNLISLKSKTTKLNEERQRLIDEMRNTQTQYFKEGLIESRVYNSKQTSLGKHLGEIEKDITYSSATKTIRLNSSSAKILWKIYYTIFK